MTTRRSFLKSSLAVPIAAAAGTSLIAADQKATTDGTPLPKRKLGKNGPEVTMLNIGGMMAAHNLAYLDIAWSLGIRYFDTADCYKGGQSERGVGEWLRKYPERRADTFVLTKDHPKQGPEQLIEMLDRRLANIGTDYVDLFFIHGIGPKEYGDGSLDWPKSAEFRQVAEQLKKSGKTKMVGFSCHDGRLEDYLEAAAEGGFVDAIMLAYNPFFKKGDRFDKALDACHAAGIGLVAMKEMRALKQVPARIPELDKLGLTPHQGILHAVWSDPRMASDCSSMANIEQLEQNSAACRSYKEPLTYAAREALLDAVLVHGTTFCPGCPACAEASANMEFALRDVSRYVTYYEQDGNLDARSFYQALPMSQRDWSGIDLAALRDKCDFHIDYPSIVQRAERYFA
jgi:aryl-alcohol dehydrogenase-like predicted oxidoreductase